MQLINLVFEINGPWHTSELFNFKHVVLFEIIKKIPSILKIALVL